MRARNLYYSVDGVPNGCVSRLGGGGKDIRNAEGDVVMEETSGELHCPVETAGRNADSVHLGPNVSS